MWRTLHDSGIGNWVKPAPLTDEGGLLTLGDRGEAVTALQSSLAEYGYGVTVSGSFDSVTNDAVTAFQRHFRPQRVDGIADTSTRNDRSMKSWPIADGRGISRLARAPSSASPLSP